MAFSRPEAKLLRSRLREPVRLITIVAGPRQVGKTTLVRTALKEFHHCWYLAADAPDDSQFSGKTGDTAPVSSAERNAEWLKEQWSRARKLARYRMRVSPGEAFIFAIDEVQGINKWSETVKGLWDADRAEGLAMHVILL